MKKSAILIASVILGFSHHANGEEPSKRDQLRISVQKICPISGEKLGDHGAPLKAKVGEETVFLCCEACLKGKVNPEHWATIHANIAKAQGICPVMKRPLPESAASTLVEGQVVYVCCPPCSRKIAADPPTYLRLLDERYAASLRQDGIRTSSEPISR